MKVFLDTNVLAAAFATRGLCSDVIREILANHKLISSLEIFSELKRILCKKFKVPEAELKEILDLVHSSSFISHPMVNASCDIKDKDDVPHISAAIEAGCDVFVAGDKELWVLDRVYDMRVISPRIFWEIISNQ